MLLAGAFLAAAPAAAQSAQLSPEEVQAKARTVLSDPLLQRELPEHPEFSEQDAPYEGPVLGSGGSALVPMIGAGAFLAQMIFMVLAVVAVALVAFWLGRVVLERRRQAAPEQEGGPAKEKADESGPEWEPSLEDANRLAREGRYGEAIHALLLAAIRHYADRSRGAVQPSRTSRELARLLPLGVEARNAFVELVRAVELTLFGGAPAGAEEWERSLARFRMVVRRTA